MILPIVDHIVKKISSNKYFSDLKQQIEDDLNIRVHYPSVEDPESEIEY